MPGLEHKACAAMVRASGSGWRPTRFAEALPPNCVCSLCRVLLESSVVLPCCHVLCDSCHTGCLVWEDGGSCALDGTVFSLQDCRETQLSAEAAETLVAYCWNEAQGCGFAGKLSDMRRHYERDCTFHGVLCPRCDAWVLRADMTKHYRAGCPRATPAGASESPPRIAVELASALRDFMTLVEDQDQMLPSLQSRLNSLCEQGKMHSTLLEQISGAVKETEQRFKSDLARTADQLVTRITAEVKVHRRDFTQQGAVSNGDAAASDGASGAQSGMPWHAEKRHIFHKLELAADDATSCLRDIRHGMACLQLGRRPADDPPCEATAGVHYMSSWVSGKDCVVYRLYVTGAESFLASSAVYPALFGTAMVWHSRSAYFVVVLGASRWEDKLDLYFRWCSTTQCPAPVPKQYGVTLVHVDRRNDKTMERDHRSGVFPADCHHRFWTRLSDVRRLSFVRNDRLTFDVALFSNHGPQRRGSATTK